MSKIKRYWPCSHGFNRDPEIQELRRKYADWMGYVWQEMCAIADLNDGEIMGTPEQISASLSYISLLKRPSLAAKCVLNALGFMEKCGWINIQTDRVLILKYAEYHNTAARKKLPPNNQPSEQPTILKDQNAKGDAKSVVSDFTFERFLKAYPNKDGDQIAAWAEWQKGVIYAAADDQAAIFTYLVKHPDKSYPFADEWLRVRGWERPRGLDQRIKDVADRIFLSDRKKFAKLIVWIKEAQKEKYRDDLIAEALIQFERDAYRIDNWWKYLDSILNRVEKDANAREAKAQSAKHKQELKDLYVKTELRRS